MPMKNMYFFCSKTILSYFFITNVIELLESLAQMDQFNVQAQNNCHKNNETSAKISSN